MAAALTSCYSVPRRSVGPDIDRAGRFGELNATNGDGIDLFFTGFFFTGCYCALKLFQNGRAFFSQQVGKDEAKFTVAGSEERCGRGRVLQRGRTVTGCHGLQRIHKQRCFRRDRRCVRRLALRLQRRPYRHAGADQKRRG